MNLSNLLAWLFSIFIFVALIVPFLACEQDCPTKPDEVTGDYIFVERIIITNAVVLAGDSTGIEIRCVEPAMFYDFYPEKKILEYSLGPEIPVNNDLKVIFGDKNFSFPPAGCGGGTIFLTPIYYLTTVWARDGSLRINEFDDFSGRVGIVYPPLNEEILLEPGDTYKKVCEKTKWIKFNRFEGGTFIPDSALVKYIDRVTVKNWGFAPRNKIVWKDFTSP